MTNGDEREEKIEELANSMKRLIQATSSFVKAIMI